MGTCGFVSGFEVEQENSVLLELFTSQGCSSCPLADVAISQLGLKLYNDGSAIPLSYHVTYWDYIGWKDPFGNRKYDNRQREYAQKFLSDSVYTPQLVVNAGEHFNGASRVKILDATQTRQSEIKDSPFKIMIRLLDNKQEISVSNHKRVDSFSDAIQVILVVFENDIISEILSGENHGETLKQDFVVKSFDILGFLKRDSKGHSNILFKQKISVLSYGNVDRWEKAGIVIILQDTDTLNIEGNKSVYPIIKKA